MVHNLYIVLTPLKTKGEHTSIEDLFPQAVRDIKLGGKKFNKENEIDVAAEYGKEFFCEQSCCAE